MKAARGFLAALAIGGRSRTPSRPWSRRQYPAWLERGGNAVPLTPGRRCNHRIGCVRADARVHLRLSEGSTVKLARTRAA